MSLLSSKEFSIIQLCQDLTTEIAPKHCLRAFDFAQWKLSEGHRSHKTDQLQFSLNKITKLKENSTNPFGLVVASPKDVEFARKHASFLYIPGEICRQSDVLEIARQTKLPLILEKGVFLAPNDLGRMIEKLQGADIALVECGSSNGYSDSILDPRSLHILSQLNVPFAINLSELFCQSDSAYPHKANWLLNSNFIEAFIKVGKAFGASFYVVKDSGKGAIAPHKLPILNQ